ncbi:MAG: hypothetical protein IJI57_12020 [Flexilinea sp.]|nr:hypothetical protein [Flexilinea sp.]
MQTTRMASVIILIMAVIYLICRLIGNRSKLVGRTYNREKDLLIRHHIAVSLEESAPIHLDLGDSGEAVLSGGAALAAAGAAESVSAQMVFADEPWVITAPGGIAVNIQKNAVRTGMEAADYSSSYSSDFGTFSGVSPIEHLTGNAAALEKAPSALHLSIGSFGAVPALTDTLYNEGEVLGIGGTDLISQAVGTVTADAVYVGEQYTEIPEALDKTEKKNSALLAMDVMRWVVIAAIVVFAGFGLSGL